MVVVMVTSITSGRASRYVEQLFSDVGPVPVSPAAPVRDPDAAPPQRRLLSPPFQRLRAVDPVMAEEEKSPGRTTDATFYPQPPSIC